MSNYRPGGYVQGDGDTAPVRKSYLDRCLSKSVEELTAELDSFPAHGDPDGIHCMADDILLAAVPEEVRAAYLRCVDRQDWWATA